ncbi:hypothetical protein [Zobellia alginiliquefaciens]|uniref:hypothetical protein n=1 Tax=Zobellia alginiliquefaciens TaxID=3032586 RepID=UPI0023E17450|nr:hypothetical protein [Zobellia alginiliquefaciens]
MYAVILLFGMSFIKCDAKDDDNGVVDNTSLLEDEFSAEQEEIKGVFAGIEQSLRDGDMDKLISYHAYGP